MNTILIWRPEPLNARLAAAAIPARQDWAKAAQMRAPRHIRVQVLGNAVGSLDPTGMFFEFGTKPHTIGEERKVIRLADGRFVTGPVRHPGMRARPFLRPNLPFWETLYRRRAMGAFRGF